MKNSTLILVLGFLFFTTFLNAQNVLQIVDPDQWWWPHGDAGKIEEATISLEPKGIYTEVGLYLTISAEGLQFPEGMELEIVLDFNLPNGSLVHDSWLWMPDGSTIVQAEVLDISKARQTYEDIVDRNRDPSILYSKGNSNYQIRIFPLFKGETRKIKITYLCPTDWDSESITTWLPTSILQTGSEPLDKVRIIHIPNSDWQNPQISGVSGKEFTSAVDPVFGDIELVELSAEDFNAPIKYVVDAPFNQENYYVGKFNDQDEQFFQLAYLAPIEMTITTDKHFLILMEYDTYNSYLDRASVLSALKQSMTNVSSAENYFQFGFLNNNQIEFTNSDWMSMTPAMIEQWVSLSSFQLDTEKLLHEGIKYAKEMDFPVDIIYVTNGDDIDFWNAENVSDNLIEFLDNDPTRIHILDYQSENYRVIQDWNIPTYISTNHFNLYNNLSTYSQGSYRGLFEGSLNIWDICQSTFSDLIYAQPDYDLHIKMDQGFTYKRHAVNSVVLPNKPILQVGKFVGGFPMEIEFSALNNNEFIYEEEWINESHSLQNDSLNREMWVGNEIKYLEGNSESFQDIQDIVNLSIEERVLSEHTAFLALDLENGGEICANCWEVGGEGIVIGATGIPENEISLSAFPNPFDEFTIIEILINEAANTKILDAGIYNMLGQKVKSFDIGQLNNSQNQLRWNGRNDYSQKVNPGIYVLVIQTKERSYHTNLSLIED